MLVPWPLAMWPHHTLSIFTASGCVTSPHSKYLQRSINWSWRSLADQFKSTRDRNWTTTNLIDLFSIFCVRYEIRETCWHKKTHCGKHTDKTHRHGHTCKYHLWAARTKKFLKGHPGYWARLQGSYTATAICEQKTLAERHPPGQLDSSTHDKHFTKSRSLAERWREAKKGSGSHARREDSLTDKNWNIAPLRSLAWPGPSKEQQLESSERKRLKATDGGTEGSEGQR